jgi:hypothetical protein
LFAAWRTGLFDRVAGAAGGAGRGVDRVFFHRHGDGQAGSAARGRISILLSVLFSIGAAGAASLLTGRKLGFYLLIFAFIGASILQVVAALRIDMAVLGLLNIGIVWWLVRPQWAGLQ